MAIGNAAWRDAALDNYREMANFIWSIADLLRGTYRQHDYGKVILPLTVMRRLDSVMRPTQEAVRSEAAKYEGKIQDLHPVLRSVTGLEVYNTSRFTFHRTMCWHPKIRDLVCTGCTTSLADNCLLDAHVDAD